MSSPCPVENSASRAASKAPYERGRVVEIIASLMWGPKTLYELLDAVGGTEKSLRGWVKACHQSGIVRIAGRKPRVKDGRGGSSQLVYAIQERPFDKPDVFPTRRSRSTQ